MEYRTSNVIDHAIRLKRHHSDILKNGRLLTELKDEYRTISLQFTDDGLKLTGRKEEISSAIRKIESELDKLHVTTLPVSKHIRSLLDNEMVYAHLQSTFQNSNINAAYWYSKRYENIISVYAFSTSESHRAAALLKREFSEEYISITKDLEKIFKRGSILQDKLNEERDLGTLVFFENKETLALHGLEKPVASVKGLIDKLTLQTKSAHQMYTKPYNKDKYKSSDNENVTGDVERETCEHFKQQHIAMKKFEIDIVSMLPMFLNLNIPELKLEFKSSCVYINGKSSDVDAVVLQIHESLKSIKRQYDMSLSDYKDFLIYDEVTRHFSELFRQKHIIASYYVLDSVLLYVCGVDYVDIDRGRTFMIEAMDKCVQFISTKFRPCFRMDGCIHNRLQELSLSGLLYFQIDFSDTLYVHGYRDSVNEIKHMIDILSKDLIYFKFDNIRTCPHDASDILKETQGTHQPPRVLNKAKTAGKHVSEPLVVDLQRETKDIQILQQHGNVLLQFEFSNKLEEMFDDILVDINDDHVHLSGSKESVETALHFIRETIDSIQVCKVDVDPERINLFDDEKFYKSMHSSFRKIGIAASYSVNKTTGLDVYAIGNIELAQAIQFIKDLLHQCERGHSSSFSGSVEESSNKSREPALNSDTASSDSIEKERLHPETACQLDCPKPPAKPNNMSESGFSDMPDIPLKNAYASTTKEITNNVQHIPKNQEGCQTNEHTPRVYNNEDIGDTKVPVTSFASSSLTPSVSTSATSSQTLPFQAYDNDDVDTLLGDTHIRDSDEKDEHDDSGTDDKYQFRNLTSASSKQRNPTIVSSRHELAPSGSRHKVTRTISTLSTRQLTENTHSTSSTSRFIMDTLPPSTSTKASTSIYSRSFSSNYEPMDIDVTSSYLYAPRRAQKLTIIDSFRVAKTKVSLVAGCITLCQVDVIINETNPDLNLCQGAVSSAILEKEQGMQAECNAKSPQGIDIGEVCITQANSIKCQFVYHVTCCKEKDARKSSEKAIKDTVLCCLTAINDANLSSVAISPLGTTRSRVPREKSAVVMLAKIVDFLTEHKDSTITHIDIVLHEMDTRSHPVFEDEFANVALKFDPERRKTRSRYWTRNYDLQL